MRSKADSLDFLATDIAFNTRIIVDIANVILQVVLQNILATMFTVYSFRRRVALKFVRSKGSLLDFLATNIALYQRIAIAVNVVYVVANESS